ncbi:MAG: isoprenylcysteine carboxylmethyltransferase family protein [Burkholderiales bacterium]|jgi:protein-S-isoprenylcysteine O-methyltransferase Ste14
MSLLAFLVLHVTLTFVWRTLAVRRRTGVDPWVLPSRDDAHGYVGRAFRAVMAGVALLVVAEAVGAGGVLRFGTVDALDAPAVRATGWAILWASLTWLVAAQHQMGRSWRIGIDEARGTELVTRGLFAWSRNPIFLGLRTTMLGLFLVLPCGATLALGVAAELLMQVQVRLEEAHLAARHGERYADYARTVARWL